MKNIVTINQEITLGTVALFSTARPFTLLVPSYPAFARGNRASAQGPSLRRKSCNKGTPLHASKPHPRGIKAKFCHEPLA